MADFTAGFETGVVGNNIKSSDAGDASPWSAGSPDTTEFAYDDAHVFVGALAAKVTFTGTAIRPFWDLTATADHFGRQYLYFTANPSGSPLPIIQAEDSGVARLIRLDIRNDGTVRLINAPASTDISTTATIALNQFIRLEWHFVHNASSGIMEARLFNDPYSITPTETLTSGSCDTGTSCRYLIFAAPVTGGTVTYWTDAIVANAASYPGPAGGPPALSLPLRLP